MSKFSEDDHKNDEARDPGVSFVGVHDLVSEESDQEGRRRDDNDSCPSWHGWIDGVEELGSNNDIYCTPSDTSQYVQYSNDLDTVILPKKSASCSYAQIVMRGLTPKKKRDKTICLKPNRGPKVEKKATGIIPRRLTKRIIRMVSTYPR